MAQSSDVYRPCIQPHALVFALREPELLIENCSENITKLTGWSPQELLGRSIEMILDKASVRSLREALATQQEELAVELKITSAKALGRGGSSGAVPAPKTWKSVLHRLQNLVTLELEESPPVTLADTEDIKRRIATFGTLQSTGTIEQFCQMLAQISFEITGYDRVVVYKFLEDWNGKVLAEMRSRDSIDSFDGLYFPSTDIPESYRAVLLAHRVFHVSDTTAEGAELVPPIGVGTKATFDINHCHHRQPRFCHLQYMKNMGVRAKLTISLIVDNRLWGLLCCHHFGMPKLVPYVDRAALRDISAFASVLLSHKEETKKRENYLLTKSLLDSLRETLIADGSPKAILSHVLKVKDLVDCGGVSLVMANGTVVSAGKSPTEAEVVALAKFVKARPQDRVWSSVSLSRSLESFVAMKDTACGLLAVPVGIGPVECIMWYRAEFEFDMVWAGSLKENAKKSAEGKDGGGPRKSFARSKDTIRLTCVPWEPNDRDAAAGLRNLLIELSFVTSKVALSETGVTIPQDLRRTFDTSAIPIFVLDPSGQLLDCNVKASKATGNPKDELIQHSFLEVVVAEESRADVLKGIEDVARTVQVLEIGFFFYVSGAERRKMEMTLHLAPLCKDESGLVQAVLAVGQLVTVHEESLIGDSSRVVDVTITQAIEAKNKFLAKLDTEVREREAHITGGLSTLSLSSSPRVASSSPTHSPIRSPYRCLSPSRAGGAGVASRFSPSPVKSPKSPSYFGRDISNAPSVADNANQYVGSVFFSGDVPLKLPHPADSPSLSSPLSPPPSLEQQQPIIDEVSLEQQQQQHIEADRTTVGGGESHQQEKGDEKQTLPSSVSPIAAYDLRAVLQSTLKSVETKALAKNLKLSLVLKNEFPTEVLGDRLNVSDLLANLLQSAIKFTSAGNILLSANVDPSPSLEASDSDIRLTLRLDVQDTGIGLYRADVKSLQGLFGSLMESFKC
mmetsp:Transcript_23623/g.38830  ORF Transcript_23623/g.38830 Transcript_23623/m.38830 type:complete len:963 (-) Transcript_23623:253-3141(-)|eukprot:CAMPEP_0184653354 /NCGR_PEP_ID=MMETSP0308-20130426/11062_1 /TAXON_ID=38269 /ORGANISM="Gloeochaete witrockiana, Strain SAG 46.84" /LENGTH=962 /DNA_ID=CAMNT_0027088753 /DNA_START=1614 /DNA_END=4502 /DNA_ORIENTATION=+